MGTIVVGLSILVAAGIAAYKIYHDKKNGKCCGGSCSGCHGKCHIK